MANGFQVDPRLAAFLAERNARAQAFSTRQRAIAGELGVEAPEVSGLGRVGRAAQRLVSPFTLGIVPPPASPFQIDPEALDPEQRSRFESLSLADRALALARNPERFAGMSAEEFDQTFGVQGAARPIQVAEGGILFDPSTGKPIFENPQDFAPARPITSTITLQRGNDTSTRRTLRRDDPEVDRLLEEGFFEVSLGLRGSEEEIGLKPRPRELEALREAEEQARGFVRLAQQGKQLVQGRPELTTIAGDLARFATGLASTAEGFARIFDIPFFVEGEGGELHQSTAKQVQDRVADRTRPFLDGLVDRMKVPSRDRARLRSMLIRLAFSAATAVFGQTGRGISDRDVELTLQAIGESFTPENFAAVLTDMQNQVIDRFEDRNRILSRVMDEPPELIDLREEFGLRRSSAPEVRAPTTVEGIRGMTRQELIELDPATLSAEQKRAAIERFRQLGVKEQ